MEPVSATSGRLVAPTDANMSPTESSSSPVRTASQPGMGSGGVGLRGGARIESDDAFMPARAFLIQLVSREIHLGHRQAAWLRVAGRQLARAGQAELAGECVRLAAESWKQREQLVVLLHRLVARWNRGVRRRVEPLDLTEQPPTKSMRAYIDLNEQVVAGATPTAVVAGLAGVERLLCSVVPFALELADCEGQGDVGEALCLYQEREDRAAALEELAAALVAAKPSRRPEFEASAAEAIASFTTVNRESAELGHQLVEWRTR